MRGGQVKYELCDLVVGARPRLDASGCGSEIVAGQSGADVVAGLPGIGAGWRPARRVAGQPGGGKAHGGARSGRDSHGGGQSDDPVAHLAGSRPTAACTCPSARIREPERLWRHGPQLGAGQNEFDPARGGQFEQRLLELDHLERNGERGAPE
jgi:hypothetical protein